ncbi:MAG: sugar phosphate isomerase/epimerase [Chloroflexi bacterium]|nr:MAG: sugar phosphate isomerase/epimerase [Chloroflexota bacterium]
MFRIAAFPKCYLDDICVHRTMTVFDWIQMATTLDAEGLEMYEGFFTSLDDDYIDSVADAIHRAGFAMPMLCCSPDFTHPDPDERARAVEREAIMIRIARRMGGPGTVCRVLTGQRRPEVSLEEGLEWVIDCIQQCIQVAREYDVVLGLENHYKDGYWRYPEFAQRMDVFLRVLDAIPERRHFGVQYDPSNALVAGDDPIALLRRVADRVVSMHASDRYLEEGATLDEVLTPDGQIGYPDKLRHGVIGQGLNDYDAIFSILSQAGYHGWVSIEDGLNGIHEIAASIEFLKQMRAKWYGENG